MNWERALQTAKARDDVLLGYLDRTEARENDFHWITPIDQSIHYLMTLKNGSQIKLSKLDILNGPGRAACIDHSNDCEELKAFGFPESRIWKITDQGSDTIPKLIKRKRAEYFIMDFSPRDISDTGEINTEDFLSLFQIGEVTSFLAASKKLKTDLLAKLKK